GLFALQQLAPLIDRYGVGRCGHLLTAGTTQHAQRHHCQHHPRIAAIQYDHVLHSLGRSSMNYRHAFHAGNFADVHKPLVLVALLERLKHKPKPLCYLDTPAGRGWYALGTIDARRGGEWREDIARLEGLTSTNE